MCKARHPKLCKYRLKCKFNANMCCAYKHVTLVSKKDGEKAVIPDGLIDIDTLKNEIARLNAEKEIWETNYKELQKRIITTEK